MAEPKEFSLAKLICGLLYREGDVLQPTKERLEEAFGPVDLESPRFAFESTKYYEREMGPGLSRVFVGFARLVGPDSLAGAKLITNALEKRFSAGPEGRTRRRVNLDPGILTASSLIMATAKDFSHRIPLRDGIYAHLEFLFTKTGLRFLDWTYPDFRKPEYAVFFLQARRLLLKQLNPRVT